MQPLGIVLDARFKQHDTGPGHPERPARIDAVTAGLEQDGLLAGAMRIESQPIDDTVLLTLHTAEYLQRLERACRAGQPYIDTPDSAICPASMEIARLAAGGVVDATRRVAAGEIHRAFSAVRPPGHHAEADRSMGFCLFNNIALAARVLLDEFKLQRVLILDWDVHHGNGTQHLFERDPRVLFISLHGHPQHLYPGTGYAHERGEGPGEGFTMNVPFLPGATDREFQEAFETRVIPAADEFAPQAILISAGFDAHADDPIGNLSLSDAAYRCMTQRALELASRHCGGRIVTVLEGGYDLDVLRRCVSEHVRLLAEGPPPR